MGKIFNKFKGSKFSIIDNIIYLITKGGIPLIRGGIFSLCRAKNPFKMLFIGLNVQIFHSNYLYYKKNFYIGSFSYINCLSKNGVNIGENVTIREFAWLQLTSILSNPGDGIFIGDNTYIGPRCNLGAAASLVIGERCQIGAGVSFIAENHSFDGHDEIFTQGVNRKGIIIGNDCWIGNNAIILDGVTVGSGVVIGAGSVVTKSLPDNAIAVGVPAKIIRFRGIGN